MVAGVILAAGRSARMGRPKALLRLPAGPTFVTHLVQVGREAGLTPILVVGRPGDEALAGEVERAGAQLVLNADADRGQLSSIRVALDAAQPLGVAGIMLMPVDVPLVTRSVVESVLAAADDERIQIVRAVHRGRHGHPVLFKRAVFRELRDADPTIGARAIVRGDPARVKDVETDERGVTVDVDTPDDYRRLFGRDP